LKMCLTKSEIFTDEQIRYIQAESLCLKASHDGPKI
jgi:hypothetical protein